MRPTHRFIAAFASAAIFSLSATVVLAAGPLTQRCTNDQYGFSVSFPSDWHTNQPSVPSETYEQVGPCTTFAPFAHVAEPPHVDNAPIFLKFETGPLPDGAPVTIDGRRGVLVETVVDGENWYVYYAYLSSDLRFAAFAFDNGTAPFAEAKTVLDAMVRSVNIDGDDQPFADTAGTAFEFEIEWLLTEEITRGCNAAGTLFCPRSAVTRAEMASFLARALELPVAAGDYFVDDENSIHEDDINRLRQAGITNGCGTDRVASSPTFGQPIYCPSQPVTRAEMASFIARARTLGTPTGDYFDDDELSVFHEDDINRLFEAGITNGCGVRLYCPDQSVAREQMAAFLYRALGD